LLKGPLPLEQVLQYAIEIADALDKAHRKGVTHRDLKPGNIMLTKTGTKLLDFGLAKLAQEAAPVTPISQLPTMKSAVTAEGTILGTLQYMAPEQILGKKVDERADIYAVGVMMYEMVTGVPPYSRGDHMSVMYQHVQGKARVPQDLNPALPPGFSDLVMKAMSVDKTKRFQTMAELSAALERFRH